jgi:hypothetical protein
MGRQLQLFGRCGIPVRTLFFNKASHAEEVQPSGRQTSWSGRLDVIMEITCNESATVWTLGQHRPDTLRYFDHNFLLKYRSGTKLASLES